MIKPKKLSRTEALKKGLAEYRKKLESGEVTRTPTSNLMERYLRGENRHKLRHSVNAKCFDCMGGERVTYRIRFCTIFNCPLWHVRPYRKNITKEQCLQNCESVPQILGNVVKKRRKVMHRRRGIKFISTPVSVTANTPPKISLKKTVAAIADTPKKISLVRKNGTV